MRRSARVLAAGAVVVLSCGLASSGLSPRLVVPAAADEVVDPVIAAVGDFACDPSSPKFAGGLGTSTACRQAATSTALLADPAVTSVLGLGDFQYDCGDLADWEVSYTPTWGRVGDRMVPVAGNHEYQTGTDSYGSTCPTSNARAENFFGYFGAAAHPESAGHFSFDVGSWHLVGLNANCAKTGVGGCSATSSQTAWLTADLAATTQPCIAAFWHQPYFNGQKSSRLKAYQAWWKVLYAAHADVVVNGHVHNFQRFAPLDPNGVVDPNGITEYVVGTGGESLGGTSARAKPAPLVWHRSFGYARFTLRADGWTAEFVDTAGTVLDTSYGTCH